MTRKKPATPEPEPTNVGDLILALASYPLDAEVVISDPFIDLGVMVGEDYHTVYQAHEGTTRYERPDVVVQEVQRSDAGEEFAIANEFLGYLRAHSISLVHDGQGHNETASPLLPATRARLAEEFATRETTP